MMSKFVLTALLIALAWFGFKFVTRMMEVRGRAAPPASKSPPGEIDDLIKCPSCQTYRPAQKGGCGRGSCPY